MAGGRDRGDDEAQGWGWVRWSQRAKERGCAGCPCPCSELNATLCAMAARARRQGQAQACQSQHPEAPSHGPTASCPSRPPAGQGQGQGQENHLAPGAVLLCVPLRVQVRLRVWPGGAGACVGRVGWQLPGSGGGG